LNPVFASPAIMSSAWLSQMPVSHVRSGYLSMTRSIPVPSGHRRGARDDLLVAGHQVVHRVAERGGEARPLALHLDPAALGLGRTPR
jgi:hypothetical protein